jgi:amidohydrolase
MSDTLRQAVESLTPEIVAWRRDFHRHPELGFEEVRTSGIVAERLRGLGLDSVRTGVGRTGVVGVLKAAKAEGKPVLLRADMDALPVQEEPGREYGSTVPGKMHACGHDGHTAMLLGAATVLSGWRQALKRDVVFCFQPAEEGQGGAEAMIREGFLAELGVGEAYGLHLWSLFPAGTIQVRPGPVMAAQDEFEATFHGRGGHGAAPHVCVDPVLAAAQGLVALQTIVARSVSPFEPAVVSVGSLHGGTAPNVIPDDATMRGTLRSFSEPTREILRRRVREVLEGIATASGCRLEFVLKPGFPAVVNHAASVDKVVASARGVVGPERVVTMEPMAAAEDFAYFLREVPGAFVFVGAGNVEKGITAPHHSPRFDIDETALPRGVELLCRLALG